MDNVQLTTALRNTCMLASVVLRGQNARPAGVPEEVLTKVHSGMRAVKDALTDCTMGFGDMRLLPVANFVNMVGLINRELQAYNAAMGEVPETFRALYGVDLVYRPVDDPQGFGMIPDGIAGKLAKHVQARVARNFEAGQDEHMHRMRSAIIFYVDKVNNYHVREARGLKIPVLRESVVANLREKVTVLRELNVTESPRIHEIVVGCDAFAAFPLDNLKGSAETRAKALGLARKALTDIEGYLGFTATDAGPGEDETTGEGNDEASGDEGGGE